MTINRDAYSKTRKYLWRIVAAIVLLYALNFCIARDNMKGKIVFSTQDKLYVANLDNRLSWIAPQKIPLPYEGDMANNPAWLFDGTDIIFQYSPWTENVNKLKTCLATVNVKEKKVTPFEKHLGLFAINGNFDYPKWSPDGNLLAFLNHIKTDVIKDSKGIVKEIRSFSELTIFDKATQKLSIFKQHYANRLPISWSPDSKKIAFQTTDGNIAVYDVVNHNAVILTKGRYPVFHPFANKIYFIAADKHLYSVGFDSEEPLMVDNGDWSWDSLIDISKDGNYLFFIGGGSFCLWEYKAINVFDLLSHKRKRLSKRYSVIHGAALYGGR